MDALATLRFPAIEENISIGNEVANVELPKLLLPQVCDCKIGLPTHALHKKLPPIQPHSLAFHPALSSLGKPLNQGSSRFDLEILLPSAISFFHFERAAG